MKAPIKQLTKIFEVHMQEMLKDEFDDRRTASFQQRGLLRLNQMLYALFLSHHSHRNCSICMSFVRLGHHNG